MLWFLALAPLLVLLYLALLRRRKRLALRFASIGLFREAIGPGQRLRRHVPPLLFLAALLGLIAATARPTAVITLPSRHELVVLAMDVSNSMRATDVQPDRLVAAQGAARAFVEQLPGSTRVAVVSFAATATVVQPATHERATVYSAIDRFQLQRGTAIGSAILVSLKQIFPDIEYDLQSENPRPGGARGAKRGAGSAGGAPAAPDADGAALPRAVAPGSHDSAVIVLLTDGHATAGPDPIESARMAAERGVRVFTVGVGTLKGETVGSEGWSMRVRLDEDTLERIAQITRADYVHASSSVGLEKAYRELGSRIVFEKRETEITAVFSAVSAGLAVLGAVLSILWFGRIP
jgi:Ca-activated chloride channel family protein